MGSERIEEQQIKESERRHINHHLRLSAFICVHLRLNIFKNPDHRLNLIPRAKVYVHRYVEKLSAFIWVRLRLKVRSNCHHLLFVYRQLTELNRIGVIFMEVSG